MKKALIIVFAVFVVFMIIAIIFLYTMGKPMYEVGNVRENINVSAPLDPPQQENNSEYFVVEDNVKLSYFTQGNGENVLIVHGGPGMPNSKEWLGLDSLKDEYRFIYYDQRGCGSSTRPIDVFLSNNYYENMVKLETQLGLTAQVADIERIRRILGEEKLTIIGHSFGGFLALLYAAEFPDNIEKLILVAPAPLMKMPMDGPDLFSNIESMLPENELENYNDFVKRYFDYKNIFDNTDEDLVALNNELGKFYYMAYSGQDYIAPENSKAGGWMVQAVYMSMGKKHDYTNEVSKVNVPTLIVHASSDFVQTEQASKTYLDIFPHAEFVVIEDAGHEMFEDNPEEFGDAITNFLND